MVPVGHLQSWAATKKGWSRVLAGSACHCLTPNMWSKCSGEYEGVLATFGRCPTWQWIDRKQRERIPPIWTSLPLGLDNQRARRSLWVEGYWWDGGQLSKVERDVWRTIWDPCDRKDITKPSGFSRRFQSTEICRYTKPKYEWRFISQKENTPK